MAQVKRNAAFWIISAVFALTVVLLLMGQTMAVFDYDFAVRLGLQESVEEVSEFGVQVNRAFGAADTIVYIPLLLISLAGLFLRKPWALLTTAAVLGVMAYVSAVVFFMMIFLPGVPGFKFTMGAAWWLFIGIYAVFAVWGLLYLLFRGHRLLA